MSAPKILLRDLAINSTKGYPYEILRDESVLKIREAPKNFGRAFCNKQLRAHGRTPAHARARLRPRGTALDAVIAGFFDDVPATPKWLRCRESRCLRTSTKRSFSTEQVIMYSSLSPRDYIIDQKGPSSNYRVLVQCIHLFTLLNKESVKLFENTP